MKRPARDAFAHGRSHVAFTSAEINLDRLTEACIRKRLEYQYAVVDSSGEAFALESGAERVKCSV